MGGGNGGGGKETAWKQLSLAGVDHGGTSAEGVWENSGLGTFLHLRSLSAAGCYLFSKMGPCQASIFSSQTS